MAAPKVHFFVENPQSVGLHRAEQGLERVQRRILAVDVDFDLYLTDSCEYFLLESAKDLKFSCFYKIVTRGALTVRQSFSFG